MPILHNWPITEFRISRVIFLTSVIRGRIHPLDRPLDPTSMFFNELKNDKET